MKLFNRMGVGAQVRLIFLLAVLAILLVLGVSARVFTFYEDFRRDLAEVEVPLLKQVSESNDALVAIQQDLVRLVDRAKRRVVTEEEVYREGKQLLDRFDLVQERLPRQQMGENWDSVTPQLVQMEEIALEYRGHLVSAVEMLSVNLGMAESLTQRVASDALSVNRVSALLQEDINSHLARDSDVLKASLVSLVLPMVGVVLLVTATFLMLLYRLSGNVHQTFSHIHRTLLRLSEGDVRPLPAPVVFNRESQEITESLETFRKTLTDLGDLRTYLEAEVADRTERLTQTNQALSEQIAQLSATQQELRLFKRVFESTAEAIVITDLDGTILDVNDAYVSVTGFNVEEVLGKNPRFSKSGVHDEGFYRQMWQTILADGHWTGEIWDKRNSGELYPKLLSINTVYDSNQQPTHYVGVFNDISDIKAAEAQLEQMAYFDRLTGLPNRRLLLDRVEHAISLCQRHRSAGAVFFLDLDKFKSINDTLGHQVGDELLIEVARRLKSCVRESDTVGRLAGDEFLVLVESLSGDLGQNARYASSVAEKVVNALGKPYMLGDAVVHTSASVGVVLFDGDYTGDVDGLITKADTAMYEAKKAGRGVVRFFDPGMQDSLESRVRLENQVRVALRLGGFALHLQPQLDSDLRIAGVEALIRLRQADGSLLAPGQFIAVAEEIHLIQDIERWVMRECCRILQSWADDPLLRQVPISINVSGQHFNDRLFVAEMREMLGKFAISPALLKLELTESVVVSDLADSTARMRALQDLGVALSMDDFGTGYSSLSYLCRLPFNEIKLDRSFVSSMMENQNDMFIVHSVLTMARLLKADVVAEGVETVEQLGALDTLGCQKFQGYLFSRPVPVEECAQWIRQHDPKGLRQRLIERDAPACVSVVP